MELNWRNLDGSQDKQRFIEEWASSGQRDLTVIQTYGDIYYMVPYGTYSWDADRNKADYGPWQMPYRAPGCVLYDFNINRDDVVGGGYLKLSQDKKSCIFSSSVGDYGPVTNIDNLVREVTTQILK